MKVIENPLLRNVRIEGDPPPPTRQELLDRLRALGHDVRPHGAVSEREAGRVADALESLLGPEYEVSYRLEPVGDGRADLRLSMEKRPLPRVEALTFSGNHGLDDEALREVMRLAPSDWASWLTRRDRLRPEVLEEDLDRSRAFLSASATGFNLDPLPGESPGRFFVALSARF